MPGLSYFRDFSHFGKTAFLQDLATIDFKGLIKSDVNAGMIHIIDNLRLVTNGHAPIAMGKASKPAKQTT